MGVLRFRDFEADEEAFELRRHGRVVRIQGRVLEAIFYFLRSGGRVVTRRDLIRGPWHGTHVSDAAVSRAIMLARRAIDDPSGTTLATVHGRGYRFVAEVVLDGGDRAPAPAPTVFDARAAAGGPDLMAVLRAAVAEARRGRASIVIVALESSGELDGS